MRIGLGVGPIITGLDEYFNKLADWGMNRQSSPSGTALANSTWAPRSPTAGRKKGSPFVRTLVLERSIVGTTRTATS
jgi:hypothetical protein